jgi:hypothetical protein
VPIPWSCPPLTPSAFAALPPGAVRARGWLLVQLERAAAGLTGRLMEHWEDVGPNSGWLGGSGENWERGPYYLRGLVALAHTLGDEALIARAQPWIEWTLHSQRPDGSFGPVDNHDWWPRMPMLEALRWHHEATGDARVLELLRGYFRFQLRTLPERPLESWGKPRGGDNLQSVLWLYQRRGDAWLLELADLLHAQTSDWLAELTHDGPPSQDFDFAHGVNRAMGFKEPALWYQRSGERRHLNAVRRGWEQTLRHHGQIQGTYSGDEFLHGRGSTQGTELCTVVELLSSFETALTAGGEPWLCGAIERLAYNALPAMLSPDLAAHQYFQLPNQIECTPGARAFNVPHGTDLLFGLLSGYPCCAANLHMGWPRFVNHLWLATADGGLAAPVLGPSEVTATVGDGQTVRIVEDTLYPFGEEVRFTVHSTEPATFPLRVCIPAWAADTATLVDKRGTGIPIERTDGRPDADDTSAPRGATGDERRATRDQRPATSDQRQANRDARPATSAFATIRRRWMPGDTVTLRLPMSVRASRWNGGAVGIERGPLVYALRIGEDWRQVGGTPPLCDYEVHPTTPWNYCLLLDTDRPGESIREVHGAIGDQPWAQDGAPVQLRAPARRLPEWVAENGVSGPIPPPGTSAATPVEEVTLIPFGCARLRIAMFPIEIEGMRIEDGD